MKKLFILATAAVALASCSDSDLVGNIASSQQTEQPQAVQFGTYMSSAATRGYGDGNYTGGQITNEDYATTSGSHSIKNAEFGVFAYYTGTNAFATWKTAGDGGVYTSAPNFMYNQRITWNNTNGYWTYDPVKYWPNGVDAANAENAPSNSATEKDAQQKVSFFAYAPYTAALTTTTNGTEKPALTEVNNVKTKVVTDAVDAGQNTGIVAMSKNTETADIQLKYVLDAASEATAVDMLWGLRGANTYKEADKTDNKETTLGDVYNVDLTKQIVDEKVKFLFKHALAKVGGNTSKSTSASGEAISGLKVKVDVDSNNGDEQNSYLGSNFDNTKTLVTIKEVKIRDKYTYDQEQTTKNNWTSDFLNWGWFDIMTGEWTKTGTNLALTTDSHGSIYSVNATTSGTYKLNQDIAEPTTAPTKSNISDNKWNISGTTGVTVAPKDVYDESTQVPGLLLIPGAGGGNTLYVTVDYLVRTADANLEKGFTEVEQVITNSVMLNNSILDPNKVYTLIMHLGLTSVKFEAVVADWSLAGGNYSNTGSETDGTDDQSAKVWLPSNVVGTKYSFTSYSDATGSTQWATGVAKATGNSITIGSDTYDEIEVLYNSNYTDQVGKKYYILSTASEDGTTLNQLYTISGETPAANGTGIYVKIKLFPRTTYNFTSYSASTGGTQYSTGTAQVTGNYKKIDSTWYQQIVVVTNPSYPSWVGQTFYVPVTATAGGTTRYQLYNEGETAENVWVAISE